MFKRKRKVRYAVIGLGRISQDAVLPAFRKAQKNSELTALVSGDPKKLQVLGDHYSAPHRRLYSEFEELLEQKLVDAVYIATPNHLHRNIMETAADHGIHVLCEKPMAVSSEDCLSMIRAAEENHIRFMTAYRDWETDRKSFV